MDREALLMEEYKALEARMQNDSRVGYNLMSALTAISSAIFTGTIALLSRVIPNGLSPELLILILLGAVGSLFSLFMAKKIQLRFKDTGDIRMARAKDIEEELGLWSFRLFDNASIPPYRTLRMLFTSRYPDIQTAYPSEIVSNQERLSIVTSRKNKITYLFGTFSWGFFILWTTLIWILVNIYILHANTLDSNLIFFIPYLSAVIVSGFIICYYYFYRRNISRAKFSNIVF